MERGCATVIVPAHNESAGISATVSALDRAIECLNAGRVTPQIALMVACNGCSDDTAALARQAAPKALVLETAVRGKVGALNHALAVAAPGPVLVNDADVVPDAHVLAALLAALADDGVLAVSPGARFDLTAARAPVRAYYRTLARQPYLSHGIGGAGIYGLSAAGRTKLGEFPPIAADDHYLRHLFPLANQRRVEMDRVGRRIEVAVRPPLTLSGLFAIEVRSRNGDRAVQSLLAMSSAPGAAISWKWSAFRDAPFDFIVFAAIKLLARVLMPFSRSGRADGWTPVRQ